MPVYGDLGTMPLTDVLQWLGVAQKTGVLEVERGGVRWRLEFSKGFVGGCHSEEPGSQFGQLLLARGMISEEQLDRAVSQQELIGKRLGFILVEQGVVEEQDVRRMVVAHVEQTIQCLFEWDEAVFRFYEGASFDPVRVEVDLSINDILLRTLQHQDELKPIREAFPSSGIVLRPTEMPVPDELADSEMSRKIFESIDGRRTIGEIVIEARASEVLVLKLLHRLLTMGLVEVAEERPVPSGTATLLDPLGLPAEPHPANFELQRLGTAPEGLNTPRSVEAGIDAELCAAQQLLDRDEYAASFELLQATFRAHPGDERIAGLLDQVAAARQRHAGASCLPPSHIPVRSPEPANETLDSEESFLLSLIDGDSDVRSIVSLAALRESEVLGTLELLLEKGWISLREPSAAEALEGGPVGVGS